MLPLDLLHAVGVMWHVMPNLDLAQRVPVAPIGRLELLQEVAERPELQRFVHQVLAPADAQSPEAAPAVDAQHYVTEMTPWELCFKAERKPLDVRHAVGEVTDRPAALSVIFNRQENIHEMKSVF